MTNKQLFTKVGELLAALHLLQEELQEHFDDHTDKWQESEAGESWQHNIEAVEEAIAALENVSEGA